MSLNKPNQELRRDLLGIAADLKWTGVDLLQIAETLSLAGHESEAQSVLRMSTVLLNDEEKLQRVLHEVAMGRIVRERGE
jgi:ADP-dependent phosphofructokinase/glucokinase